jgi:uncharacterized protein YdeI (YjbR/CyaY-like superfamily)
VGDDVTAVFFRDTGEFRAWLEEHHASETELWIEFRGKDVPDRGMTWAEAVPEALCFGWIDSVSYPYGDNARRQRWTPRKARSTWSKINVAHVERLLAEGRMHPAGIAAYERRTDDNSGIYSFEREDVPLSPELQSIVEASPAAMAFLAAAAPGYRKTVRHWISSAKQQSTRERRARQLVECCAAGELIPQARAGKTPACLARAAAAAQDARA